MPTIDVIFTYLKNTSDSRIRSFLGKATDGYYYAIQSCKLADEDKEPYPEPDHWLRNPEPNDWKGPFQTETAAQEHLLAAYLELKSKSVREI